MDDVYCINKMFKKCLLVLPDYSQFLASIIQVATEIIPVMNSSYVHSIVMAS